MEVSRGVLSLSLITVGGGVGVCCSQLCRPVRFIVAATSIVVGQKIEAELSGYPWMSEGDCQAGGVAALGRSCDVAAYAAVPASRPALVLLLRMVLRGSNV